MNLFLPALLSSVVLAQAATDFQIDSFSRSGRLGVAGAFTNGVCTVDRADNLVDAPWRPLKNVFTTNTSAAAEVILPGTEGFLRVRKWDLSGGRAGFTNLTRVYGLLSTIAGAGGVQDLNNWRPEFEGAPATSVFLSGPHMAAADTNGCIYIADKDAHGIRKVRPDTTIITYAGTNERGNGPDTASPATQVALNEPNGLWVREDGTIYILDLGNGKVRRVNPDGICQTLFAVPGGILFGRGLWVSPDETLAYVSSLNVVKRWTAGGGVTDFAADFMQLGNLAVEKDGHVLVSDRGGHRVYRLDSEGNRTVVAGNGGTSGGGDGQLAVNTGLEEVRAVWPLPGGGFFVATHRGSQVWYVDADGFIHLFLHGHRNEAHAGDGTWFYNPSEARVSEVRAVTLDPGGNLLITEHDLGYVRKVEFLPVSE